MEAESSKHPGGVPEGRETAEAIRRFEAITDTALSELPLDALLHELLDRVRRILTVDSAAILLQEGDVLVARAARGLEEEVAQGIRVPVGRGFTGRIAAERRPITIEDVSHADLHSPILRQKGMRALLGVPVFFEERVVGVLHVGSLVARHFTKADAQLLQVVADRVALGIAYSRLWDEERKARARAEIAERRSRLLAEVSASLASSLDYEATLRNIARLVVPAFADCCIVDLADAPDRVRRLEALSDDPATQRLLDELIGRYPPRPDRTGEFFATLRSGRSLLLPEVPVAFWEEMARDADHLRLLQQLNLYSIVVVPLWVGGGLVGLLSFLSRERWRYGEGDRALAEEIGRRASVAIENARLYQRAQDATERLARQVRRQRALAEASRVFGEASLEVGAMLGTVVRHVADSMGDACAIRLISSEGALLPDVALHHPDADARAALHELGGALTSPTGGGLMATVLLSGEPLLVPDVDVERLRRQLGAEYHPHLARFPMQSVLVVPLQVQRRLTGMMILVRARPGPPYDADDQRLLQDLADRAALAIERDRLHADAQQARADAEAASRAKDEFLATVSHELRTPLAPMLAWTSMLQRGVLDAARGARALDAIGRNARSLAQLIEDLLDVSRIVVGKLRLEVRPMELVPVIDAAVDAMRPAADAKAIRLDTELDPDAGLVSGDPERLQQVVWNLVSNAIKFTERGGTVGVALNRVDSFVELSVRDSGKGISAEFLPHLFERFRQADSSSTRLFGGLGLGLAIVRHLVELHGGTVWADSPGEGRGAVFSVRFPILAVATHGAPARVRATDGARSEPPRLDGLRVLVVDDDPETCEVVGAILAQAGGDVRTCTSPPAAREELRRWHPDVLVSDVGMPGEDGYTMIKALRQAGVDAGARIPAVALTAYARPEDRVRALGAGFQTHVAKPIEPDELVAVVASLAGIGRNAG